MKIFVFDADLYCKPCGQAIASSLPDPTEWEREHPDSNDYPVEYDSSEDESDTPDHCGNPDCQLFLERPLTEVGREYVRQLAEEGPSEIVQQWMEYYDIKQENNQR